MFGGLGSRPTLVAVGLDIVIADPAILPLARVLISHGGWPGRAERQCACCWTGSLDAAAYWWPGQQVAVGDTLLDLVPYKPPDAALHPSEDGAGGVQPAAAAAAEHARFGLRSPPGLPMSRLVWS